MNSSIYHFLELVTPGTVELVNLLVLNDRELGKVAYKRLGSFGILLGLEPVVFHLLLPIFFTLVTMALLLDLRRENRWCTQNLVEVLELLSSTVFV
jgi:hypothetical protein